MYDMFMALKTLYRFPHTVWSGDQLVLFHSHQDGHNHTILSPGQQDTGKNTFLVVVVVLWCVPHSGI